MTIPTKVHDYVGSPSTIYIIYKTNIMIDNISKFKEQRKILRLTQMNFCLLLGISQGYLSDLESNKKVPSKSLMLLLDYICGSKLSKVLPVDGDSLLSKQKYIDLLEKHTKISEENIFLREKLYGENKKFNGNPIRNNREVKSN